MGAFRVSGTPTLRINGVRIDGATDMSVQQLVDLIKSLFTTGE